LEGLTENGGLFDRESRLQKGHLVE
jgi:hypothetical protein